MRAFVNDHPLASSISKPLLCLSWRRTSSSVGLLYDVIFKYLMKWPFSIRNKVSKSTSSLLLRINNLLSDLGQQLQDPQVRNYRYGTIIKSLTSLISGNKACMKIKDDLPKLKITARLAGNANNILQPRFHSTEIKKKKETQK
jgi:hypothetical protein